MLHNGCWKRKYRLWILNEGGREFVWNSCLFSTLLYNGGKRRSRVGFMVTVVNDCIRSDTEQVQFWTICREWSGIWLVYIMSAKLSTNQMQIETRRYSRSQTLEAYYITISIIRLFRLRYFDFKKIKENYCYVIFCGCRTCTDLSRLT